MSNRRHRRAPIDVEPVVIERPGIWSRLRNWLLPPSTGPVCVAQFPNRAEADLAAGFLRGHGVNARVSADDAGGTDPVYQFAFGVRVLVPHDQADQAGRLLADLPG